MSEDDQDIGAVNQVNEPLNSGETSTSASPPKRTQSNKDKIRLKLILTSGKTHEYFFTPETTAGQISKHVFDNWPEHWEEERATSHRVLRLIFQGRFLHANVSLGALKLPVGKLTVMHLVPREKLPQPPSQGEAEREKSREGRCHNCCNIL